MDFLLTARRDRKAALPFLSKAIKGITARPRRSRSTRAAPTKQRLTAINAVHDAEHKTGIEIRQCKYLNNIVEQDLIERSSG